MSKTCARASGGKFITIYPPDTPAFERVIEKCDVATRGFVGPYIISDSRYRDSGVVFYRYGEHTGIGGVDASGRSLRAIRMPDGNVIADRRDPLAAVPAWLSDPFGQKTFQPEAPTEKWIHQGRYRITGARRYSNWGGIYRGEDRLTGRTVIIREARPYLGDPADTRQPQNLLRKQARIMDRLRDTNLTPDFIDLFEEHGHLFLVEQMLEGDNLWGFAMNFGHFEPIPNSRRLDAFVRHAARSLIEGLTEIHEHRIVLRDLTKSNVFFTKEKHVKFFDFEFAFELDGSDLPLRGGTEGYMSAEQRAGAVPTVAEDYYALGAILLDLIAFSATGLGVNRPGILASLHQTLCDLGLPSCYEEAIAGLTATKAEQRIHPKEALRVIEAGVRPWPLPHIAELPDFPPFETGGPNEDVSLPARKTPSEDLKSRIADTIGGITSYIRGTLRPLTETTLWAASPEIFMTNPVSLAFGASGVLCYLHRVGETIPPGTPEWIIQKTTARTCPPGLYMGQAGVALCLLQIGLTHEAEAMMEQSNDMDRIIEIPGLYHGAAGWALANISFWFATRRQLYLDRALEIGWYLLRIAKESEEGAYWETNGEVGLGLGYGSSGIALLMIYLNAARSEHRFLELAEKGLDHDIANARWAFGRILWTGVKTTSNKGSLEPHTRFGSAGIGTAAIRAYAVMGEPRFKRLAEQCAFTASTRLTNKLWQDYGLSGAGEFLIDMFTYLSDDVYLNTAYYLSETILLHAVRRLEGIAFAGAELLRLSCDFAMGSSGIGWFLHRLLHPTPHRLLFPNILLSRTSLVESSQCKAELPVVCSEESASATSVLRS
ncbi:MAG TPA: lanthionine synthetase LanC family protein [Terriglobales bacterium]|nr:lanthionine synthetase LanC family protein [Terriglobales bacterium]